MKCPKCGVGDVVVKQTRKGRKRMFWGCSRYSKEPGGCDWATWNDPTKTPEQLAQEKEAAKAAKKEKRPIKDDPIVAEDES
jgi:DNA topoisomerase-1